MKLIYNNLFSTATVVASEENAAYPASNLKRLATTDEWRTNNATGSKTLVIDLGSAKAVDAIGIVGNNYYRSLAASTITLEGNSSDSWSSPAFSVAVTVDSAEASAFASFASQTYRYWRIVLAGAGSYLGLSSVFLGAAFDFTDNGLDIDMNFQESDLTSVVTSNTGRRFIDEQTVRVKMMSLGIRTMNKTEMGQWRTIMNTCGKRVPFFLIVDQNEVVIENKDVLGGVFMFDEVAGFSQGSFGYWDCSFNITEVI